MLLPFVQWRYRARRYFAVHAYYAKLAPASYCFERRALAYSSCMSVPGDMNHPHWPDERRSSERRSISQAVQYRVLGRKDGETAAAGKTLNMSSSGILFTTTHTLLPGRRVELAIDWPARLDNKCALRLVARGRVVRFEGDCAALEILQHEFRTRSARA
jgi:PilZ domain